MLSKQIMKYNYLKLILLFLLAGSAHAKPPTMPEFQLPTRSGEISSTTLKNQVVYVDFWASWCKPCEKSFPWLNRIHEKYSKLGLKVVAINLDRDKNQASRFLRHTPAKFTVAFDPAASTAEKFQVQGMPTSYLVDRKGQIRARHIGFRDKDKARLEQAIESLLKEQDNSL